MKTHFSLTALLALLIPTLAPAEPTLLWQIPGSNYPPVPVVGDLGGAPGIEVVSGLPGGGLLCLTAVGDTAWTFSASGEYALWVKAADVDADGATEVIFVTWGDPARLGCLSASGTEKWSVTIPAWAFGCPAIANVDEDPELEIFIASEDGMLRSFDGFGDPGILTLVHAGAGSPALGDIDADDRMEVLLHADLDGGGNFGIDCVDAQTGVSRWKTPLEWSGGNMVATPCLIDVDGDGSMEVLVNYERWVSPGHHTACRVCLESDGSIRWSDCVESLYCQTRDSGAAGDIDQDGVVELVSSNELGVFSIDGEGAAGWQYPAVTLGETCLVDLDADGAIETLVAFSGSLHCIDSAGEPSWVFPLGNVGGAYPIVADLNGDGAAEIVLVQNPGGLKVLATDQAIVGTGWPTYHGDNANTGSVRVNPADVASGERVQKEGIRLLSATGRIPLRFEVAPSLGGGTYSMIDPQGRLVWSAPFTTRGAVSWSGETLRGARAPAGVYFIRVESVHGIVARQIVLLE